MIPKILGIGATILATGFILALPSVFEGEPANEVEPIRFGPRPILKLADARVVEELPLDRPGANLSQPVPEPPALVPAAASGGTTPGDDPEPAQTTPGEDDGDGDDDGGEEEDDGNDGVSGGDDRDETDD